MKTERWFMRALVLLLLSAVPGVASADIPPPDIEACWHATEGAPCCGGTRTCVLSQCTYYMYAYSGTDAAVPMGPELVTRDAASFDAETGGDAEAGPSYPRWSWYPCLSCPGVTWSTPCRDAGVPGAVSPGSAVDAAQTGGASQPGGSGGKRGGGCVVGGWLSARALAPWALAGLFATLVTLLRRRRPNCH